MMSDDAWRQGTPKEPGWYWCYVTTGPGLRIVQVFYALERLGPGEIAGEILKYEHGLQGSSSPVTDQRVFWGPRVPDIDVPDFVRVAVELARS